MYTRSEAATLLGMSETEFDAHFERNRSHFVDGEDCEELRLEAHGERELYFFADALPKLIDACRG
jgi:hypothetical protein